MSKYLSHIQCLECQHILDSNDILQEACPECGSAWLDAQYDYDTVATSWSAGVDNHEMTLWRYDDLLPTSITHPAIPMGEGNTPLHRLYQYEKKYGYTGEIYIKDERSQPTNSFKDRQAALSVMAMAQAGITECALASTGNAAVAYAAYCARASIKLWLFLTSLVPPEKMREAALYGCEVIKVSGTYDETKHVAAEFAKRKGIRFDKGAKSIPGKESMKTMAYEIAGQLALKQKNGKWQVPDWYIQAVSGGIGPIGVWKGFEELLKMGLIDRMPKLAIVQAAGCAPMVKAFDDNQEKATPVTPNTLIHVLATGDPGKGYEILREACLSNGGVMVSVEDGEAFQAMREAASLGGLSVEPATSVAFAGLSKMLQDGTISGDETVVLNCSGHTFPAESHILSNQYDRYIVDLELDADSAVMQDGLGSAIRMLDEQVTTVLVVDDNPNDRRLIRRLLQSYKQYRVYEARDGQEALAVIKDREPDLIVTDLMMPHVDGFQLVNQLRNDPATARIPIVVATAKSLTEADKLQLDQTVSGIWQKATIEPKMLVKEIVEALGHDTLGVIHPVKDDSDPEPETMRPTIMIIDDNMNDRRLARRILETSNTEYDILEASTGRDGLKMIYEVRPELLLLDINLPDMTGLQIIETLQNDAHLRDIPVVIYSAGDLDSEEQQHLQASIRNVIRKSQVDRREFLTIIEDELS